MSSATPMRPAARNESFGVQTTADHERRDDDAPENDRIEELGDR
jgi:hypothetical protein